MVIINNNNNNNLMFTPFLFRFFFIHGAIVILCYCRHIFTNRQSYLPILLSKLPAVIAATIVIIFCCHHRYWLPSSSLCSFVVAAAIIIVAVVIVVVAASIFITSNVIIICYYCRRGRHYSLSLSLQLSSNVQHDPLLPSQSLSTGASPC